MSQSLKCFIVVLAYSMLSYNVWQLAFILTSGLDGRRQVLISNLLIGITFHFVEERLEFLKKISAYFSQLSRNTRVLIFTNTASLDNHKKIVSAVQADIEIFVPKLIGHPYLLTWAHFDMFRKLFQTQQDLTHFMYLEDDILIKPENIEYWLEGRANLKQIGLIPSFLRCELAAQEILMRSTDVTSRVKLSELTKVNIKNESYCYINLPQPYQGMYILDRELAEEHLFGPSSSPEFGPWGIREKAAQGLTFANVPSGCTSRNFVGFNLDVNHIDSRSLIHHTPNNYANDPQTKFGKIPIKELIV